MWSTYFSVLFLLSCYTSFLKSAEGRQYDLNEESMRLFGEDLNTTLYRFRQTPEYQKILTMRVSKMLDNYRDMADQVVFAYKERMVPEKINKILDIGDKSGFSSPPAPFRGMPFFPKVFAESTPTHITTTFSPVEMLDAFLFERSVLSVAERNACKDAGFEVAKAAIQKIIKSLGKEEDISEKKSTRMPSDDFKSKVTTTSKRPTIETTMKTPTA